MHGQQTRGHQVVLIDEGVLPDGIDWMFIEPDGEELAVLAIQRDRWSPALMVDAWSTIAEVSDAGPTRTAC